MESSSRLPEVSTSSMPSCMSFLPARQAVQTCVLSRRWEDLWSSSRASTSISRNSARQHLLNLREQKWSFMRFKLSRDGSAEASSAALKRWTSLDMPLPQEAASCWGFVGFTKHLPSGCPVLEDLKLDRFTGCTTNIGDDLSITAPNLVSLDLVITVCGTYRSLSITAPNLVSFHLVITVIGWNWAGILVNEMPSLAKGTICLIQKQQDNWSESISLRQPCKLLCSLTDVRDLKLSGSETLAQAQPNIW
ncbi:LOW QUALITY PROTEIN: hypothetical protein U9M48_025917 [Paspalum notatum var. saurae]|uniref:Uncharacterized protein n=1 Tax=Paspalum notatum var. saurae TaxID=547442 RepID=A0AAQ3WY86_PASNO